MDGVNLQSHPCRVAYPPRLDPGRIGENALVVVEEQGWDSWSLREVAKALGVTPTALYRHVGNRAGLHVEIAAAAARALSDELTRRGLRGTGIARVAGVSRRYVRFGMARPHAYAAFTMAKPSHDHPSIGPWLRVWDVVQSAVATAVPDAADAAAFALWALLHGRIHLATTAAPGVKPDVGLDLAVRALLEGFAAMGHVPSPIPKSIAL